jgi:hypothetical protein
MNRALKSLLALMVVSAVANGQTAAPTPTPATGASAGTTVSSGTAGGDATASVLADHPAAPVPPPSSGFYMPERSVSPAVAEALSLGMPKYSPPTPTPVTTNQPQDMRDVDKPKNEIKRLPSYIVHDSRPPVFRDRDLYTKDGLVSLSYKLHPGLGIGNLAGLNDAPAYEIFLEDERLANMADLNDTAKAIATGGDLAEGKYILEETQDTYMRTDQGFNWSGPGGGVNGGGGGK